jgi:hypothetical protein
MNNNSNDTKKILRQFTENLSLLKNKQKEVIEKNIKIVEKRKMEDIRKKIK